MSPLSLALNTLIGLVPPKWGKAVGALAIIVGIALPYLVALPAETNAADALIVAGTTLILAASSETAAKSSERRRLLRTVRAKLAEPRGFGRVGVLVTLALAGILAALLSGCASTERNGTELEFVLRDDPARPAPACVYELRVDGELLHRGAIDECPVVPACEVEP